MKINQDQNFSENNFFSKISLTVLNIHHIPKSDSARKMPAALITTRFRGCDRGGSAFSLRRLRPSGGCGQVPYPQKLNDAMRFRPEYSHWSSPIPFTSTRVLFS